MTNTAQLRSLDFFDPANSHHAVDLVGVGGIGSFTAHALARLGVTRLGLYDDDTVDPHNVGCQAFDWTDVTHPKVDRISRVIEQINPDCSIQAHQTRVSGRPDLAHDNSVVITAVDSMSARADIFNDSYLNPKTPLYVDARIAGELVHVHAFNPTDLAHAEKYRTSLHSDDEAIDAPCTAQNVIDVGYTVAALIVRLVRSHLSPNDTPPANFVSVNQHSLTMTALPYNDDLIFS